jgi:acetolactate synthase-1/3 small subunit
MTAAMSFPRSHTIVALLQDHPGVLHRAVSLLRRRGYNIASLAVGRSEMEGVSRMTLVVEQDDVEQVVKQLNRLVEVLQVDDVTHDPTIEREVILVKVAGGGNMQSIVSVALGYGATIADVGMGTMLLELSGSPAKVEGFLQRLAPFGILEATRTGRIAMVRGRATHSASELMSDLVITAPIAQSPEQWLSQADGINGTN